MSSGPAPGVDATRLRAAAQRLEDTGAQARRLAARLGALVADLRTRWHGDAADAAVHDLEVLTRDLLLVAATHSEAAGVLDTGARTLDDAHATWQRARAMEAQDLQERERAAARGAFVSPYESAQLRWARAVAAEAHALAGAACARVEAQLRELAARRRRDDDVLSLADQVTGFGRGMASAVIGLADLVDVLRDPVGSAGALREGLAHARQHPKEAAVAAAGLEELEQGRYGEWAGGLVPDLVAGVLSGGTLPAGRRAAETGRRVAALAEDDARRYAVTRASVPGGPVRPRPGAVMTPRYPKVIRPLSPERQRHVLVGDPPPKTGGGHRPGAGRGKSEFPTGWTDDDIVRLIMDTAMRPVRTKSQERRRTLLAYAEHRGTCVQVVVDPKGKVVTGYPVTDKVAAEGCGGGRRSS